MITMDINKVLTLLPHRYPFLLIDRVLEFAPNQATGLLGMESNPDGIDENTIYFFVGIDKARFKRPVEPGDQMHLEVEMKRSKRGIWMFSGTARVDGMIAATADIMCTARDYRS